MENYRVVKGMDALKALKEGKELFVGSIYVCSFKFVDNILCKYDRGRLIVFNCPIEIDENSEFRIYEKPQFKLEVGKIYEDKDGGKYFIYAFDKARKRFLGVKQGNDVYSVYRFKEDGAASKWARQCIKDLVKEAKIK